MQSYDGYAYNITGEKSEIALKGCKESTAKTPLANSAHLMLGQWAIFAHVNFRKKQIQINLMESSLIREEFNKSY